MPALSVETGYFDFNGWYLDGAKIEPGYVITKNITLTAVWDFNHYEYVKTDYSKFIIKPTDNSNFSVDGEYTKITPSTSIANWVISKREIVKKNRKEEEINYSLSDVYGFELKVKCDTKIDWAGMEWFNKTGYSCYYFEVHGDGSFKVRYHDYENSKWINVIDVKAANSNIVKNDFNILKLAPNRNSDFEIYINDNLVGTIKRTELLSTPGSIAFAGTNKKDKAGSAWLKILSYEQVK